MNSQNANIMLLKLVFQISGLARVATLTFSTKATVIVKYFLNDVFFFLSLSTDFSFSPAFSFF